MAVLHTLSTFDYLVFLTIILFSVLITFYNKWKYRNQQTLLEYMVMGRTLTLPFFIITLVSTWYGGIFAVTEISFKHGIYNFITQGFFWYLSAFIFAMFFVNKACNQTALSFPDIIGNIYGPKAKNITALLLMIKTLPITYVISIGLCLQSLFGISLSLAMIISTFSVALYCAVGGMRAIVLSDIMQFILMFSSIILVIIFSYHSFGGYEYLKEKLPPSHFTIAGNHNNSTILLWLLIAFNTTLLSPVFYQRCFAAKSPHIAKKGILIAIVFWFICDICTTLGGMYAKAHLPNITPTNAYFTYALKILPEGFKGLFIASILITLFSALDSYLFISSTVISYDLLKEKIKNKYYTRLFSTIITAIISIVIAFQFENSLEKAWIFFESFFLAALFFPLIFGYFFTSKIIEKIFILSVIASILTFIMWEFFGLNNIIESFFISLTASFFVTMLGISKFREENQKSS